jgi:hypothetical protein
MNGSRLLRAIVEAAGFFAAGTIFWALAVLAFGAGFMDGFAGAAAVFIGATFAGTAVCLAGKGIGFTGAALAGIGFATVWLAGADTGVLGVGFACAIATTASVLNTTMFFMVCIFVRLLLLTS